MPTATPPPPRPARARPPAAQPGLIRGLYTGRAVPWRARTTREAFLTGCADSRAAQFLTEPDTGQVTGWLLPLPRRVTRPATPTRLERYPA